MEKPAVHCFIARRKSRGRVRAIHRVTLDVAWLAKQDGWLVVGPDPDDMRRLEQWRLEHQSFNPPHA